VQTKTVQPVKVVPVAVPVGPPVQVATAVPVVPAAAPTTFGLAGAQAGLASHTTTTTTNAYAAK
jgi:hypothetical protein